MRYLMTAFATLSLGALPMTAQVPARPTQPNLPAQPSAPPAPITEQQRQQHQAIREKYAKEMQVHRDAIQGLNEKMRAEIDATLTPEQREFRQQRAGGRGMGMGLGAGRGMGMAQGGGRMGGMALGNGRPPMRAMLWRRADRAARQIIGMRDRMMLHAMMQQRGRGMMGPGNMMGPGAAMGGRGAGLGQGNMMGPGQGMGGRGGMMNGMGPGQPPAVAKRAQPSKAAPAPVKKPATTGGGGN